MAAVSSCIHVGKMPSLIGRLFSHGHHLARSSTDVSFLRCSSIPNIDSFRQMRLFSDIVRNPSDFDKIEYAVPGNMVGRILGKDKQVVNQIKALSGSVIRFKKEIAPGTDSETAYFVIGGTKEQIKKAVELIEEKISKKSYISRKDGAPLWTSYRRNFKGQKPPQTTRHKCIRAEGKVVSGNPCPLCSLKLERDKVVDFKDIDLLKQFICPDTDQIIPTSVTGLCRQQHEKIVVEIEKSRKYGYLPFTIPMPNDAPVEYKPVGIPSRHTRVRR